MATRNRTDEFINLRNMRAPNRNEDERDLLGDGASAVKRNPDGTRVVPVPPAWVHVMEGIRSTQMQIATEHQALENLHRTHLKVEFGVDRDHDNEEREIETLTQSIKNKFKHAENEVKELDRVYKSELGPNGGSDDELSVLRNVKMCLVNELTALSRVVRDGQRRYLKALDKQKASRDRWAGGAKQREVEERLSRDAAMDDYIQRGCTQEQVESVMLNARMVEDRDQELQSILNSIKSLHEMFADLHTLVIEQGTLLDRIDHNMNVTHDRIVAGKKELVKAAEHQKAGTFKLCVLLLIILIIGFAIALLVKIAV